MIFGTVVLEQAAKKSCSMHPEKQNSLTLGAMYHSPVMLQKMFLPYLWI